ncbi:MAG: polysaccharide lyase family 1 protein [Polyangiaceae bacterium]
MVRRLVFSAFLCSLAGCAAQAGTEPSGNGGSTGKGGSSASGGSGNGGQTTSNGGSSNGGAANGGSSNGGSSNGGSANGGSSAGGSSNGGSSNGGSSAGGSSNGGSSNGGSANGGSSNGGTTTASGGTSSGGKTTGGTGSGGTTTGTGGTATGTGGTASGGKTTGGTGSGGTTTGSGGTGTGGTTTGTGGTTSTGCGTTVATSKGAAETKPVGYGQAATGGGSVAAVSVATMAAMQSAVDAYSGTGGLVLKYTGTFNFASIPDPCTQHTKDATYVEIKNKSNITILGADGSAANFGIFIKGSASNIIIRNMTIGLAPGGGSADLISIEGQGGGIPKNIWVDHNELFTSMAECAGAGDTSFDGMIDIKSGADNVTVSYNILRDHHKVSLDGHTEDETNVSRHVTFHHNIFQNVGSRTPLQRYGHIHNFSNYYNKVLVSGINVRQGGYSLIESNFFENSLNIVTSRDSANLGYWELRNNNIASPADFAKCGITWSTNSDVLKNADDWTTTKAFPVSLGYSYTADAPNCVKSGLATVAGAGKGLATLKCN